MLTGKLRYGLSLGWHLNYSVDSLQKRNKSMRHFALTNIRNLVFLIFIVLSLSVATPQMGHCQETGSDRDSSSAPAIAPVVKVIHPSMVTIRTSGRDGDERGIGVGFFIDPAGLIATNHHVIGEGRDFTVHRYTDEKNQRGERLKVTAIEASDRNADLAIVRVDPADAPYPTLKLSESGNVDQGERVLAFGNPLGMRQSVVEGIVSAVREIDGQSMLQLAMPTQPGNSGGPLITFDRSVVGIVNMKSAIDDNLGFAIPVDRLKKLMARPNPVAIDRWVRLGKMDDSIWKSILGAQWKQTGGMISARGQGAGFGGRALCIRHDSPENRPFEVSVDVRLNDPSGAAGLVFCSDGNNKHYGFYPSAGKMRLTCFKGPNVYTWQILQEIDTPHFIPGQWNRLRVRLDKETIRCFVNGELVVESKDRQLTSGSIGLAKFRGTEPDFKRFRIGDDLADAPIAKSTQKWLDEFVPETQSNLIIDSKQLGQLAESSDLASRVLRRRADEMRSRADVLGKLASDVERAKTIREMRTVLESDVENRLAKATLLIAKLDNSELDVDAYLQQMTTMVSEIRNEIDEDADATEKLAALDKYLFDDNGFHGGRTEYYHVANSHLNRVIDDREGLPITLSILYMELGRQLGLKIEGVGLPGHFVTRFVDGESKQLVDVFDGGTKLSEADAKRMVRQFAQREITDDDVRAQNDEEILTRVLSNLMGIATRSEDPESMIRYIDAVVLINPELAEYRMMRAQLRGITGRNQLAIEDLQWMLENQPPGINLTQVQRLIDALQRTK